MRQDTSKRMQAVHMPPIHPMMNRVRKMKQAGETVYSMAQAVPWYTPPEEAVEAMRGRMSTQGFHFYSPDPGLLSTREALAWDFQSRRGIVLDPSDELHLTCGASQAFLSAILAVADPGDRVIVLEPYYFDHVFAVQFASLLCDCVPMTENEGWSVPWGLLEEKIPGARALVLVNPGNPTGSVLSLSEIRNLVHLTEKHRCTLIIDETYERFNFTGSAWHPWMDAKPPHVITLGSFSKSYSLSGWRLGYLFGPGHVLAEALKVQDSAVICPPTPAQILLEECLSCKGWVEERSMEVRMRLELCKKALGRSKGLDWRNAGGGFFTLAAAFGNVSGYRLAELLLERYGIAAIPGEAFGATGRGHMRISFGCLSRSELQPAMEALASVNLTGDFI